MSEGQEVSALVISRFIVDMEERPKASLIFEKYKAALCAHAGVLNTSVWHMVSDDSAFMRITEYTSVDAYNKVYDAMAESGELETAVNSNKLVPDVQIYNVVMSRYHGLDHLHNADFLSLSDRVLATPSQADEWIAKLKYNFDENALIPGFFGMVLARHYDVEEQVAGVALWRSAQAFRDSQPDHVEYEIDLYKKVM